MAAKLVIGSGKPVETSRSKVTTTREATVIEVEGRYVDVEKLNPKNYCPAGLTVESSKVTSTGNGMGKLTVSCIAYDESSGAEFGPVRTTIRITMQEVQYDLEDHPHLKSARDTILKWLATDEAKRVDGGKYKYTDANDNETEITDDTAKKFCAAYMAGIKTFNRYYPVIEKISTYKNPPGLARNEKSFTGGSPTFSAGIGKFGDPPISLNGYGNGHWFSSKDEWVENADKTWQRTQQWTYTPESSSGYHAWIYNNLT